MKKSYDIKTELDSMVEKISGPCCVAVVGDIPSWISEWSPRRLHLLYPEHGFDPNAQAGFMHNLLYGDNKDFCKNVIIITRSPFIVSDFDKNSVIIVEGDTMKQPFVQTFGASINEILLEVFDCKDHLGDIAKVKLDKIIERANAGEDIQTLKEEMRAFGQSVEKVLVFHHLLNLEKNREAL